MIGRDEVAARALQGILSNQELMNAIGGAVSFEPGYDELDDIGQAKAHRKGIIIAAVGYADELVAVLTSPQKPRGTGEIKTFG